MFVALQLTGNISVEEDDHAKGGRERLICRWSRLILVSVHFYHIPLRRHSRDLYRLLRRYFADGGMRCTGTNLFATVVNSVGGNVSCRGCLVRDV